MPVASWIFSLLVSISRFAIVEASARAAVLTLASLKVGSADHSSSESAAMMRLLISCCAFSHTVSFAT